MDDIRGSTGRSRGLRGNALVAIVRLLLMVGIVIGSCIALWRGGVLAILAWVFTVIILIDTSVNVIFALYDTPDTRLHGFFFWLYSIFWGAQGVQMVTKECKVKPMRPAGPLVSLFARLGAPGIVVIDNGVAVIFERSGRMSRVHGPGLAFTKRFERVAQVIDLRPQVRTHTVQKIMTRDGLSFDLDRLDVLFEVAADFDPRRGEYAFSEEALLDLVYRGGLLYDKGKEVEWGERAAYSVEYHLRNVASKYDLEDIVRREEDSPRQHFMDEVEALARPALRQVGVRLRGIDFGQIVVPHELRALLTMPLEQRVDLAWADTQKQSIRLIADGLRQAINTVRRSIEKEKEEAKVQLLMNLTDMLESISQDFLRLSAPYRESPPEVHYLLPGGEESPGEGKPS